MSALARRREALRRLGATFCRRCRNLAQQLYEVADWTQDPIRHIDGLCRPCAERQQKANEASVKRSVANKLAKLDVQRDTHRAQMAPSSPGYREACAAMQSDVDAALGGWKIGPGW